MAQFVVAVETILCYTIVIELVGLVMSEQNEKTNEEFVENLSQSQRDSFFLDYQDFKKCGEFKKESVCRETYLAFKKEKPNLCDLMGVVDVVYMLYNSILEKEYERSLAQRCVNVEDHNSVATNTKCASKP